MQTTPLDLGCSVPGIEAGNASEVETQSVSADVIGYVYRIDSETPGIQPITAKLRLSKNGNTWSVSEFVQSP